jgi:carbon storage regulator
VLVISRETRQSIIVAGGFDPCLITLLRARGDEAVLLISHGPSSVDFDAWTVSLRLDGTTKIGAEIEVSVVDVRGEKVRLGVVAPKWYAVHRLEVWEAIKQANRRARGEDRGEGSAGVPARPPNGPTPPPLNVRLDLPPSE